MSFVSLIVFVDDHFQTRFQSINESILTEREDESKQDERYFVKIHAPFDVLLVLVSDEKSSTNF
jgi:hypothetical protein